MVTIDNKNKTIIIEKFGDASDLYMLQTGLIELLQHFDWENGPNSTTGIYFYSVLELLKETLLDDEQLTRFSKSK